MIYRFANFELDDELFELRRDGVVVPTQARVFDFLAYLIARRDVVVTNAELLKNVWRGATVTKDSIPRAVMVARSTLGDAERSPRFISTVRGRGYRFVAEVSVSGEGAAAPAAGADPDVESVSAGAPFVGRDAPLSALLERLRSVASGACGAVALISGEAGVGKTRLVEELIARANGVRVASTRCWSGGGAPEGWPFVTALAELRAKGVELSTEALALTDRAELRSRARDDSSRFDLAATVAESLEGAARERPLLLFLDDAHRADPASLAVVELLSQRPSAPLCVVVAHRTGVGLERASSVSLANVARAHAALKIPLEPLSPDDVSTYLRRALGATPPALAAKVYDKTKGNPLLLGEVVQLLKSSETLERGQVSTTTLVGGDEMRLAVVAHLAALPESAARVLTMGAVFGAAFELATLAAASDTTNPEVLEHLDAAERARIVSCVAPGRYAFSYPLVRDVLYRGLAASERAFLHARAGAALSAHAGGEADAPTTMEIARHYCEAAPAGHVDAAVAWATRAAELALADGARGPASRAARLGLAAMGHAQRLDVDAREKLRALARLADEPSV